MTRPFLLLLAACCLLQAAAASEPAQTPVQNPKPAQPAQRLADRTTACTNRAANLNPLCRRLFCPPQPKALFLPATRALFRRAYRIRRFRRCRLQCRPRRQEPFPPTFPFGP